MPDTKRELFLYLAPAVSGLLLAVSFPPFKLFLPPLVALVPLFYFLENESSRARALLGAAFCGLIFWGALLYWITLFTRAGFVVLILVMSLNQVIFAVAVRRLSRTFGLPLALSAPFVWTAIDYLLHSWGDLAFTWGQLAYSLTHYPLWLQGAAFVGSYGITFWVVTVNSVAYELVKALARRRKAGYLAAALCLLLAAPPLLGTWRYQAHGKLLSHAEPVRVSYVQPSIPQEIKWERSMRDSTFQILGGLTLNQEAFKPLLVVWPEAAAPSYLRTDSHYRAFVGSLARELDAYLFTGAQEYRYRDDDREYDSFNSAFLFDPQGEIVGKYDKIQMVPISERMPWENRLTFLQDLDVGGSHFVPGTRHVVFSLGNLRFGALICFESIFPELSRDLVTSGADFLVNITNDAWFERTTAVYQHSSFLTLRAIENGRDIVRAANTGISAFYDRLGRRRKASGLYERTSSTDTVYSYGVTTFYARHGDFPALFCSVVTLILLLFSLLPCRLFPGPIKAGVQRTCSSENSTSPKRSGS